MSLCCTVGYKWSEWVNVMDGVKFEFNDKNQCNVSEDRLSAHNITT